MQNFNNNSNLQPNDQTSSVPQETDERLLMAKGQAEMLSKKTLEELESDLKKIDELKFDLKNTKKFITYAGIVELESKMRNFDMPGIYEIIKAGILLNMREEANEEIKNLKEQGKEWSSSPPQEQNEIADRIKWGADYQNSWQVMFDAAELDGAKFTVGPINAEEKKARQNLNFMVGNEIELALSRNPKNKNQAKNNPFIDRFAENICSNRTFLNLINKESSGDRNIRLIRLTIEKLLKENLENDITRNLQSGSSNGNRGGPQKQ